MRLLLTNDDGWNAMGINALAEAMKDHEVTLVAPKDNRSAIGSKLTLYRSVDYETRQVNDQTWYGLDAAPCDCVRMSFDWIFKGEFPDLVLSGINHGANIGLDMISSGTFSAAATAAANGVPSVALSLSDFHPKKEDLEAFALFCAERVDFWRENWKPGTVWNLNAPKGGKGELISQPPRSEFITWITYEEKEGALFPTGYRPSQLSPNEPFPHPKGIEETLVSLYLPLGYHDK